MTAFVGREAELAELGHFFAVGRRLVTVLGPPGTGKTRIARELCAETSEAHLFCELSSSRNAQEVLAAVAAAAGATLHPGDSFDESVDAVGLVLAERGPCIVVLDNVEQVTGAASPIVQRWLTTSPEAQFLATSRHRLDLVDEYVFELGPLAPHEAVDLFVDRARMLRRDFAITSENRAAVNELVRRLDCLPLAIELAAARSATLAPLELLARLDARFKLLRARAQGGEPRQATLEAAIAWSWDLLSDSERATLAQCAVFVGGFTVDAAEAVVRLDDGWVLDELDALRAKSLVARTDDGRFVVYESIRDFAREHGEEGAARERHAAYFASLGESCVAKMHGRGGNAAMRALERESPNLLAAFEATKADAAVGLRIGACLDQLLRFVGPSELHERVLDEALSLAEGPAAARFLRARAELFALQGKLEEALSAIDAATPLADDLERGWLALREGEILRTQGEAAAGADILAEAIAIARAHGEVRLERTALAHRANCMVDVGALDSAREVLAELAATRRTADLRRECELLKRTAYAQYYLGNYAEQRRQNEEALELATEIGDRRLEGLCLQGLGDSCFAQGDFDAAVDFYARGLAIHQALGNVHYEAMLLGNLGGAHHRGGQLMRARKCYARSLELHRQTGARPYEGVVSFALGALEHESGNADDAHFHYDRAVDIARETNQPSDVGALALCKAWLDLESPDFAAETLRRRIEEARQILAPLAGSWDAVATATMAFLEKRAGLPWEATLDEALDAVGVGETTERAIVEMLAGRASGAADIFRRSLHARLARRLVEQAERAELGEPSEASAGPTARVGPDVHWFELPGAERVDLRRRKALRLVLQHLLELHETAPGRGSDVIAVFDAGWPEEEIHPDQAVERVYWAVRTLRKLGFEDVLLTSDEGYHLSESLRVEAAP